MVSQKEAVGIALFVDLENLISSAYEAGLPVDLEPVISKLKEYGPIRFRKGYGDLRKVMHSLDRMMDLDELRRRLQRNLVEISDIPFLSQYKNTADMTLVVDALSLAFQNHDISHYAILASDRDYVPLYNKLREIGKSVIAVGVDENRTNAMLREASDSLIFYSLLFPQDAAPAHSQDGDIDDAPIVGESVRILKEEYFELLVRSLRALEEKGRRLQGITVQQQMRALRSDFQPERVGCPSFKAFVEMAKTEAGIRTIPVEDSDEIMFQAPSISPAIIAVAQPQGSTPETREQEIAKRLSQKFEDILRLPMPDKRRRKRILDTLSRSYKELIVDGAFRLQDLSSHAEAQLRKDAIETTGVFKLALSLYFARCFNCIPTDSKTNPEIVGMAKAESIWEDRLLVNMLRVALQSVQNVTPRVASIALFGGVDDADVARCDAYIEEASE